MSALRSKTRIAVAATTLWSANAAAVSFDVGDTTVTIDNLFTVGAVMRMQKPTASLIGKSNLNPGLCVSRTSEPFDPEGNNTYEGDTCSGTVDDGSAPSRFGDGNGTANDRYVAEPGSYNPNGDNGNLNFEQYDVVHATAKWTADIGFDLDIAGTELTFFARPLLHFDAIYSDFTETHPDDTMQFPETEFPDAGRDLIGHDIQLLDAFVSTNVPFVGDRDLQIKVGRQVLNWGESAFLLLNSLNTINPPNQALLRLPGFDIKELLQPVGMVYLATDIVDNLNIEAFYQYEWEPVTVDPVGSFYSVSDTLGAGGTYAMLSFGKAPEDPNGIYEPYRNPDDPVAITGSQASRTIMRDYGEEARRRPDDGGQYGVALKWFAENVGSGTEFGLYYANYHARIPSVSAFAADATCIPADTGNPATNLTALFAACEIPLANVSAAAGLGNYQPAGQEALPVDTMRLFVEYPENIRLYGVSFNTTLGDWAWAGEYAFRENLPIQIHSTDLVFAGLQPAFPEEDYGLGIATLPGRRTAVPDFISQYRNVEIQPGDYIRGYESMKIGELETNFIKFIGGGNPVGASQIVFLLELGLTHVLDFPDLSELQFNGGGTDTHISNGADGTQGINPADVADDPAEDRDRATLRQNPTAHADRDGFGSEYSYGYRLVSTFRYDNALGPVNLEPLIALFHDVGGTAPGLGQNFVQGRKQIIGGVRFDYLNRWYGELRYSWFTGGGKRDALRDRDNLQLSVSYQF